LGEGNQKTTTPEVGRTFSSPKNWERGVGDGRSRAGKKVFNLGKKQEKGEKELVTIFVVGIGRGKRKA